MQKPIKKPLRGAEKTNLHQRNLHRNAYDFERLTQSLPALKLYVRPNAYGTISIDFSDPKAVKCLNQALLKEYYSVNYWDIPESYLCPPIPGRSDYIHYLADLLAESNGGNIPTGPKIKGLDIGAGANLIYPLLANSLYNWSMCATDIDETALVNMRKIISQNTNLEQTINIRKQKSTKHIFEGILEPTDLFDFTVCNPPFHASAEEAFEQSSRKIRNLKTKNAVLNFGGYSHELWCEGGEKQFVKRMIQESKKYSSSCFWFTTLISKGSSIDELGKFLREVGVQDLKMIEMSQGHKTSRFIAWTFLTIPQQKEWRRQRWL
ncbi:MAG: 23S rRNA (adenine(1618)-N(6))-methyltransferase RlmF [Bacteroidia bacterium]|nr:23S rRNA (adenine(1618)-N(6))-methyltransferase RlmF [Bacteroidia bacterium]